MAAERMYLLVPQLIAVQLQFLVQDSEILCRGNVVSWEDMSGVEMFVHHVGIHHV